LTALGCIQIDIVLGKGLQELHIQRLIGDDWIDYWVVEDIVTGDVTKICLVDLPSAIPSTNPT